MTDIESKVNAIKLKVLKEQQDYLCKYLGNPSRYHPFLKARGIIDTSGVQKVDAKVTDSEKVDQLIEEMLKNKEGRRHESPLDLLVEGIYKEGVQNHIVRVLLKAFLRKCADEGIIIPQEEEDDNHAGPLPPLEPGNKRHRSNTGTTVAAIQNTEDAAR